MSKHVVVFGAGILLVLLTVAPAFARIGETPEQCEQRYGESNPLKSTGDTKTYHKGDFSITIAFLKGKAAFIEFVRDIRTDAPVWDARNLSEEEIQKLLTANASGKSWKKQPSAPLKEGEPEITFWLLEDNSCLAIYVKGVSLKIVTREYDQLRADEAQAEEDRKKMEGEGF